MNSWKIAKKLPLHKKGPRKNIQSYRPISNFPSIPKMFEKCLMSILEELKNKASEDLASDNQHRFKPGHSMKTAVSSLKLLKLLKEIIIAAFDLLEKDELKRRMEIMNYTFQLVNVKHSWLSQKSAFVKVNKEISRTFDVKNGGVRGSVTGPTLS
jgi:hypothetical protein